jgi:hypothetical protein
VIPAQLCAKTFRRNVYATASVLKSWSAVGSGTGAVVCRTPLGHVRRFQLRARLGDSITPSPAPATSNWTGGFPASSSPRRRLPSGLCVRSAGACFRAPVHHAVVSKEAPRSVHQGATPPLPAESLAHVRRGRLRPLAYLRLKFLQTDGGLYHPAPASLLCSDCLRQCPFAPRALPRFVAHTDPSLGIGIVCDQRQLFLPGHDSYFCRSRPS